MAPPDYPYAPPRDKLAFYQDELKYWQQERQRLANQQHLNQQEALHLQNYQQNTSQSTSQGPSQQPDYPQPTIQRGVPAGSILLPVRSPQLYPSNLSFARPQYPPPLATPLVQVPAINSGSLPRNAHVYSGVAPVQGPSRSNVRVSTNTQLYPPGPSTIGQYYPPPLPTAPQVQVSSARGGEFCYPQPLAAPPTNTRKYSGPPFPSLEQFKRGAPPPLQVPSARRGGLVATPPSRYPPGLSIDTLLNPPPPPSGPATAPQNRAIAAQAQAHHLHHQHHQLNTGTQQPPAAKAPRPKKPKKPKSSGKHPHTEPRMCKQKTRTFIGCPCTIITLESCKGDKLTDEDLVDPSALAKCEEFQEIAGNKTGNCKGEGNHWACPAMIKFWSERKIEWQDGSFIWV